MAAGNHQGLDWAARIFLYSLPKGFSYSPLTLALSRKGRGEKKERTFGNHYKPLQKIIRAHHQVFANGHKMIRIALGKGWGKRGRPSSIQSLRSVLMPEIQVKGMSCSHCVAAMTKALQSLAGVGNVVVDLPSGRVSYDCITPIPQEDLVRVIKAAGFELVKV
jgi:copper chaperone